MHCRRPDVLTLEDQFAARERRPGPVEVALGLLLESLQGFKVAAYLDVSNETRRLMWRLAHAHGTLLAVVNILYAVPSLALFIALIPAFGLTDTTVVIALTVFSLCVILPNVAEVTVWSPTNHVVWLSKLVLSMRICTLCLSVKWMSFETLKSRSQTEGPSSSAFCSVPIVPAAGSKNT